MSRTFLTSMILGIILAPIGRADSSQEARAVVARAVQAMGGEALVRQARAVQFNVKGTLAEPMGTLLSGEAFMQLPDRLKVVLVLDLQASKITSTEVLDGQKAWSRIDLEQTQDESALVASRQDSAYVENVANLYPLLEGNAYTLTLLGDVKIKGQPAVGVQVASKGRPDVKLFFDKASGFLIKTEHRHKDATTGKMVLREEYLSDYREVDSAAADEKILTDAKLATDGPALLDFLRKRTFDDARRNKIKPLIRKLGDDSFEVREKARDELIALGEAAVPFLTQVVNDPDSEIARRAKECLQKIGKSADRSIPRSVIRLLVHRKPAGTAAVLLDYLPNAPDEEIRQEVQAALGVVAFQNSAPDKVLAQALEDKDPGRREAAAAALKRGGGPAKEKPGQRLFLPGLKRAMKGVDYHDGKVFMDWELTDVKFFNAFPDSVFARPK